MRALRIGWTESTEYSLFSYDFQWEYSQLFWTKFSQNFTLYNRFLTSSGLHLRRSHNWLERKVEVKQVLEILRTISDNNILVCFLCPFDWNHNGLSVCLWKGLIIQGHVQEASSTDLVHNLVRYTNMGNIPDQWHVLLQSVRLWVHQTGQCHHQRQVETSEELQDTLRPGLLDYSWGEIRVTRYFWF